MELSVKKASRFFFHTMPKLHYFNPGHEAAVLMGTPNYTAPENVRKMQKDLASLPLWYADAGDYVYVNERSAPNPLDSIPITLRPNVILLTKDKLKEKASILPTMEVAPWGLSPQSIHLFELLQEGTALSLAIPAWNTDYFHLTSRRTVEGCSKDLRRLLPDQPIPSSPHFCKSLDEAEKLISESDGTLILKTPYSSSGRGLLWLKEPKMDIQTRNWIKGAIKRQGMISIEKGLDKVQDFAMEFYSDGEGTVRYEGLSLFNTEERGAYTGNILEGQEKMLHRISQYVEKKAILRIQEAVRITLEAIYGNTYKGYLGVDMLVYRQENGCFAIHPCVEINMRYTMGMVALRLYQHYIHPDSTGYFRVDYEKESGEAYDKHQEMLSTYPLILTEGKIKSGYLSLCPVLRDTHYRAYIFIQ